MMPPPPIPWTVRPTSKSVNPLATAARMAPTVKKTNASRTIGFLPKMSENNPKLGCRTVEASKKEVPDQNASMAEPRSFCEMICSDGCQS